MKFLDNVSYLPIYVLLFDQTWKPKNAEMVIDVPIHLFDVYYTVMDDLTQKVYTTLQRR